MSEQKSRVALLPLAAQYHYEDGAGNQIIFMKGRDVASNFGGEEWLPPHESRWLAYAGAKPERLRRAMGELARRFSLDWRTSQAQDEDEAA